MHPRIRPLLSFVLLPAIAALATAQQNSQSNAHAEARASAQNGESRSSTHRVVVVNGKTVVDERTENGKPVGGGQGARPVPAMPPMPTPASTDEMLRRLQEEVRRRMEEQHADLPVPARPAAPVPAPRPQSDRGKPAPRRA